LNVRFTASSRIASTFLLNDADLAASSLPDAAALNGVRRDGGDLVDD
jgi:hypothetical protein